MTELKEKLLAHIQTGQISMKPKWHFIVRSISLGSGFVLAMLLGLYFMSLVLFILRESGIWWTPGFGLRGLLFFITTSPWLLIIITLIFLSTVYILIRHFGHNYRHHAIYSLITLVLVAILGTSLMHYFSVHDGVRNWSKERNLNSLNSFYQESERKYPRDITPGRIVSFDETTITIENPEGIYLVTYNDSIALPPNDALQAGRHIMVFGTRVGSTTIEAKGIRPLPPPLKKHLDRKNNRD